ncbi:GL22928 [Drosophila persimilis]|uniref:GL22928 n=1 Tax=Drosophila persimilis TaxID=7234 RepID=B4IR18_DROPE|nr:GL22928 [Drosophila persimilis]
MQQQTQQRTQQQTQQILASSNLQTSHHRCQTRAASSSSRTLDDSHRRNPQEALLDHGLEQVRRRLERVVDDDDVQIISDDDDDDVQIINDVQSISDDDDHNNDDDAGRHIAHTATVTLHSVAARRRSLGRRNPAAASPMFLWWTLSLYLVNVKITLKFAKLSPPQSNIKRQKTHLKRVQTRLRHRATPLVAPLILSHGRHHGIRPPEGLRGRELSRLLVGYECQFGHACAAHMAHPNPRRGGFLVLHGCWQPSPHKFGRNSGHLEDHGDRPIHSARRCALSTSPAAHYTRAHPAPYGCALCHPHCSRRRR